MIGLKFNQLTVLEEVYDIRKETQRGKYYLCKCDCGKLTTVIGAKLKVKKYPTKSCGCSRLKNIWPRMRQNHPQFNGYKELSGSIWSRIKATARTRNIPIEITIEDAYNLFIAQDKKCKLTGLPIEFAENSKKLANGENTASLDRIDSSKGYTMDNIQWVHKDINYMKMCLSQERFIELAKLIAAIN